MTACAKVRAALPILMREYLDQGERFRIQVQGRSMEPVIPSGTWLEIAEAPVEALRVGDVIAYEKDGTLIVHRVMKITRTSGQALFVLKGDGCLGEDPPVTEEQIVGLVPRVGVSAGRQSAESSSLLVWSKWLSLAHWRLWHTVLGMQPWIPSLLHPIARGLGRRVKVVIFRSQMWTLRATVAFLSH